MEVHEPVTTASAKLAFVVPAGYERLEEPRASHSPIWASGVRIAKLGELNTNQGAYFCMVGACLLVEGAHGHGTKLQVKGSTSNLTTHLQLVHDISGARSDKLKRTKEDAVESKSKRSHVLTQMDPTRFWALTVALVFIRFLYPLSHVESEHIRVIYHPDIKKQSAKMLKRSIVELYLATRAFTVSSLAKVKQSSFLPMFHLNIDLWKSKSTAEKFLGIRLFFVDENFNYCSKLLAVKAFNPHSQIRDEFELSSILLLWLTGVLGEFGLSTSDLMSSTTDAGSDIKRLGSVLLESSWDWCLPHMLNCTLVEAFGSSLDPSTSKNPETRAVLVRAKKVVEFVNKSEPANKMLEEIQLEHVRSALRLTSDVPQRWKSSAALLERLLVLWHDVRTMYARKQKPFLIDPEHALIQELYSLMAPIVELITTSQSGSHPAGPAAVCHLVVLLNTVLKLDQPLSILTPTHAAAARVDPQPRAAADLHPTTRETRKLLRAALDKRLFKRYSTAPAAHQDRSQMMDCCAFLYPPFSKLPHVDHFLAGTSIVEQNARCTKEQICVATKSTILRLGIKCEVGRAALQPPQLDALPVPAAGLGAAHAGGIAVADQAFQLLFGGHLAAPPPVLLTPEAIVQQEMEVYKAEVISMQHLKPEDVLKFWRTNAGRFPNLALVARAMLGFAVSAAAIERDFSVAGDMVGRKRGSLKSALVEMMLYLHMNIDDVPSLETVVHLGDHVLLQTIIPDRFKGQEYKDAQKLSSAQDIGDDVSSDDSDEAAE